MTTRTALLATSVWLGLVGLATATSQPDPALLAAVHTAQRTPAMVARDPVRHPAEELAFFGVTPASNVIEIWPGGGYWTEMLSPYLAKSGTYSVVLPRGDSDEHTVQKFRDKFVGKPGTANMQVITGMNAMPAGSADFVLTFRNVHNWMDAGQADEVFADFFKALKPGGILGVEEHRALDTVPQDPKAENGYVRQDFTVALAKKAGFELVDSSELDANPRDTKNYPQGVWTLPPTFALGDKDHAKYAAIGEADNFILKFRKPAK